MEFTFTEGDMSSRSKFLAKEPRRLRDHNDNFDLGSSIIYCSRKKSIILAAAMTSVFI